MSTAARQTGIPANGDSLVSANGSASGERPAWKEGIPAMLDVLDPLAVRRWFRHCADALGRARAEIDALNVFPVPDGDTGTNLHLTLLSAAEALDGLPGDAGS